LNETVPVGIVAGTDKLLTVAVRLTSVDVSAVAAGDATNEVDVVAAGAGSTTKVVAADVTPPYPAVVDVNSAVIMCDPTVRDDVASDVTTTGAPEVAGPDMLLVAPIWVDPSKNLTLPALKVPDAGAMSVEKVTLVPAVWGLARDGVGADADVEIPLIETLRADEVEPA
jgi:hypothetical protein